MQAGSPPAPARPKKVGLVVGIVLLVASIVIPVTGVVVSALRIGAISSSARVLDPPGTLTMQLDAGRHGLWAREGRNLTGYDVAIVGPAGSAEYRRFGFFGSSETITRDGRTYEPDGFFEAPQSGEYAIALSERSGSGSSTTTDRVLVGPPDGYVGTNLAIAGLSVLFGSVAFVIGLVVLVVALVRRSRAKKAGRPGGASGPPGGYGYGQPYATPQPGYPQPAQPGYPQPGYPQPGRPQPSGPPTGHPQPGTAAPAGAYPQPGTPPAGGFAPPGGPPPPGT